MSFLDARQPIDPDAQIVVHRSENPDLARSIRDPRLFRKELGVDYSTVRTVGGVGIVRRRVHTRINVSAFSMPGTEKPAILVKPVEGESVLPARAISIVRNRLENEPLAELGLMMNRDGEIAAALVQYNG